jgi:hypothetical protein
MGTDVLKRWGKLTWNLQKWEFNHEKCDDM